MYQGNQPCPGCGKTGHENPRPLKDGLCYDCQKQLEIGRAISRERKLERNYYKMDDLSVCHMTWYTIRDPQIEKALCNLLKTFSAFDQSRISDECRDHGILTGRIDACTGRHSFVLPKVTFEAAQELCNTINEAARELNQAREDYRKELEAELSEKKNEIYNEGVEHGRNLLLQLNAGKITLDQFHESIKKY